MGLDTPCICCSTVYLLAIVFVPNCPSARPQCKMFCKPLRKPEESFRISYCAYLQIVVRKLQFNHRRIEENSIS